MKKVATIILNRNLPDVAEKLYESINRNNNEFTDIYIVEAGTDKDKLSKYCTWWANWGEAVSQGLRTPRGFNYGLLMLWNEKKFYNYDHYLLLTNDTEFQDEPFINRLLSVMNQHPRVGILSPCSSRWGEKKIITDNNTKYFWYVHNVALLIRRQFVESIMNTEDPTYMNFLYDGTNFRGYGTETELVIKGYANDWASAITTAVYAEENERYLKTEADLIKTESFENNIQEYIKEGRKWMKNKYGFNSHWTMQMYAKFMYSKFFEFYPELIQYKI